MSILIKDMEMPTSCCDCFMDKFICLCNKSDISPRRMARERHPDCPLVEVPFTDRPTGDMVEVVRCKDCKHQEKFWHGDKRRKDGGYYIYGCELADGYSHVCLDDDFCSRAEKMEVEHEAN